MGLHKVGPVIFILAYMCSFFYSRFLYKRLIREYTFFNPKRVKEKTKRFFLKKP